MSSITADARPVNAECDSTDSSADFAPFTSADLEWAALAFNDEDRIDDDDMAACEAAFLDAHELGLLSPGLGESLSRGSLVGLHDEMTAIYRDEAERISGRRPSRESAEHSLALAWFRLG